MEINRSSIQYFVKKIYISTVLITFSMILSSCGLGVVGYDIEATSGIDVGTSETSSSTDPNQPPPDPGTGTPPVSYPSPSSTPLPPDIGTPVPPDAEVDCGNMSDTECDVLKLVNYQRSVRGIQPLQASAACTALAQDHAEDMYTYDYLSHINSGGESFQFRFIVYQVGGAGGENIARGFYSPENVMDGWLNSDRGHKENILNPNFRSMGVGYTNLYWVQCFTTSNK